MHGADAPGPRGVGAGCTHRVVAEGARAFGACHARILAVGVLGAPGHRDFNVGDLGVGGVGEEVDHHHAHLLLDDGALVEGHRAVRLAQRHVRPATRAKQTRVGEVGSDRAGRCENAAAGGF